MSGRTVEAHVPGDKSISHRALFLAALADGESRVANLLDAADLRSTTAVLRALGVEIGKEADVTTVRGRGLHGLGAPDGELDCGNSGTTARFLLGVLAGCPVEAVVTGDDSLRRRPMRRVTEPLAAAGALYRDLALPGRLPVRVRGTRELDPIDVVNVKASAQVRTAMLLAGLTAGVPVRVTEQGRPRDHTERLLGAMGVEVWSRPGQAGEVLRMHPPDALWPLELRVPGDISSAAFFLALGAIRGAVRVRDVGLNPTRLGALQVLERMGAAVATGVTGDEAGEPVGHVTVAPGDLAGTTVTAAEVPTLLDEIPVLAVLAARARGETRFQGVAELRVKESDRIAALVDNFRTLGVEVDDGPDHLHVRGTDAPLSGSVDAFGDHRIAMAFGVLGALPGCDIEVRGAGAVGISYPGFWDQLERVERELEDA